MNPISKWLFWRAYRNHRANYYDRIRSIMLRRRALNNSAKR